ncbi:MAG: tyrosine-type recombinase/integrase [Rhodocyclaceae bacterium]|nr:tyrosine-type recombinase/integrase [Rhodocyclaceae bacterium]
MTRPKKSRCRRNTICSTSGAKRVGISNFRWHDLRHTWASWHVQAGTPLHVLRELGGWECMEMVRKYAQLSSDHLVDFVDRLSDLKQGVGSSREKIATFQLRAVN